MKTTFVTNNHAIVELHEKEKLFLKAKDFVLYIRDSKIEEPSVFMNVSPDGQECALSVSILPSLRPLKLKEEFFTKVMSSGVDLDQKASYSKIQKDQEVKELTEEETKEYQEEEDELVEPYLYDYVFIIDRSGSMGG